MEYTIEEFKHNIEEVIAVCYEEIEAINRGEQRKATVRQIDQLIIPEMQKLLQMINNGSLTEPGDRYLMSVQAILKKAGAGTSEK